MLKVAALTAGRNTPSSRFRIRQYIPHLRGAGILVHDYVPFIDKYASLPTRIEANIPEFTIPAVKAIWEETKVVARVPGVVGSWRAHVTWLTKGLLKGRWTLEPLLKCPLVYDADDATWLARPNGESAMRMIAKRAAVIIAGNKYVADWFVSRAQDVRIVPTAIDTERWKPSASPRENNQFVVGWTGIGGNFHYLYDIECVLGKFLEAKNAELLVIADRRPKFSHIPSKKIRFVTWSPSIEATAIQQMTVGIMPLRDTDWERGKCSFKMLQYMACGIPLIASPVGMNREIFAIDEVGLCARTPSEWYEALDALYMDGNLCSRSGANGRRIAEERFSTRVVSQSLIRIFREFE